jgi:hypothetical protein
MLAPYFRGLLNAQSDFGHPTGAVLPTKSFRTCPKICLVARIAAVHALYNGAGVSSLASGMI